MPLRNVNSCKLLLLIWTISLMIKNSSRKNIKSQSLVIAIGRSKISVYSFTLDVDIEHYYLILIPLLHKYSLQNFLPIKCIQQINIIKKRLPASKKFLIISAHIYNSRNCNCHILIIYLINHNIVLHNQFSILLFQSSNWLIDLVSIRKSC